MLYPKVLFTGLILAVILLDFAIAAPEFENAENAVKELISDRGALPSGCKQQLIKYLKVENKIDVVRIIL